MADGTASGPVSPTLPAPPSPLAPPSPALHCGTDKQVVIVERQGAEAIDDIRKAREEIMQHKNLPDSTRKEVLKELDAELPRLKRES